MPHSGGPRALFLLVSTTVLVACGGATSAQHGGDAAASPAPSCSTAPGALDPAAAASRGPWPQAERDALHTATAPVVGPQRGTVRWRRHLEGAVTPGPIVGAGDVVYAASNGGVLHAIDLGTGRDLWAFDGGGPYGSDLSTSPALLDGGLLLWPGPRDTLDALDAATGRLLWQRNLGAMVLSPAPGVRRVYVATMDGRLNALTVSLSGAHVDWTTDLGTHAGSYGSPAVGADGTVYETAGNRIVAVRDDGDRATLLWHFDIASGTEVSPAVSPAGVAVFGTNDASEYGLDPTGHVAWRFPRDSLTYSSPAVAPNGVAYFGDHRGRIDAVDTRDGCSVATYGLAGEVWTAPAIDRDGDVYAGTKTGHITGFHANGTRLFDIATAGVVDSYPAIAADGTLLIGSGDGNLYAIR